MSYLDDLNMVGVCKQNFDESWLSASVGSNPFKDYKTIPIAKNALSMTCSAIGEKYGYSPINVEADLSEWYLWFDIDGFKLSEEEAIHIAINNLDIYRKNCRCCESDMTLEDYLIWYSESIQRLFGEHIRLEDFMVDLLNLRIEMEEIKRAKISA